MSKQHKANYAVIKASDNGEINQAIRTSLELCPYISLHYELTENRLLLRSTYNPEASSPVPAVPNVVDLTKEEILNLIETKPLITQVSESNLPGTLTNFLKTINGNFQLTLPIVGDGKLFGVIILSATSENEFSSDSVDAVIQLTEILPSVYENANYKMATTQRLKELEEFASIGQTITSSNDLAGLFKSLHTHIISTIGNVDFAVAFYNSQNETIELPYVSEGGQQISIAPFPFGEGAISVLIRTCQPLMLVENTERNLNALGAHVYGKPAQSWLGCPLIIASGVIGALVIQDLEKENRFTQDHLRFLIELSSRAAEVINNIRQIDENRRHTEDLISIMEILKESTALLVIDDILRQAVKLLCEKFSFFHAAVYLLDETAENAVLREAAGIASDTLILSGNRVGVGSKSIIGYVTQHKDLLVVNDTVRDGRYQENPLLAETKSEACFPLLFNEKILGVVDVQSDHPYFFTDENIRTLKIFSDLLAISIKKMAHQSEAQERISQHRLLHHIVSSAVASPSIQESINNIVQGLFVAMGGNQISILLADQDQTTLEVQAAVGYANEDSARLKVPFGVGVTGWVAAHRQILRIADTTREPRYISINPKVRSELALPLIYRNEVLGVINIESVKLNAFTESDEDTLDTLAGSLSAILAHSRLLAQYRTQVEREHRLYEIADKIRRTTNPAIIIALTADELSKTLNARRTQIEISLQNIESVEAKSQILDEKTDRA